MNTQKFITLAQLATRARDGFSINLAGREPIRRPGWFMVSLAGHELPLDRQPGIDEVTDYIAVHRDQFVLPWRYLGGWYNRGIWCLDVSVAICGLNSAIRFARANAQEAIFDLWAQRNIWVENVVYRPERRKEGKCQHLRQCVRWSPVTTVDKNKADAGLLLPSAGADSSGVLGLLPAAKPLAGKCQLLIRPSSPNGAGGRGIRDQYSGSMPSGGEGMGSH